MKNRQIVLVSALIGIVAMVMSWVCSEIDNLGGTIYFGAISIILILFFGWMVLTTKPNEEFAKGGISE